MYHISSFQHPPQGLGEQRVLTRIWPRYRVSASARNRLELNVDMTFFKAVKKKLVKYFRPKYWDFFFSHL